jgi:hypothetical protein
MLPNCPKMYLLNSSLNIEIADGERFWTIICDQHP